MKVETVDIVCPAVSELPMTMVTSTNVAQEGSHVTVRLSEHALRAIADAYLRKRKPSGSELNITINYDGPPPIGKDWFDRINKAMAGARPPLSNVVNNVTVVTRRPWWKFWGK